MDYNDRVTMIAQEMANTIWPGLEFEGHSDLVKHGAIDTIMPSARIAVAKMAEAFKNGWECGYAWGIDRDGEYCITCHQSLIDQGLIPNKTE